MVDNVSSTTSSRTSRTSSTSDPDPDRAGEPVPASAPYRLVHPFPSVLDAIVTGLLAALAGGGAAVVGMLAVAMLLLQFSIGTVNDLADAAADAVAKPWKPIPAGVVSVPLARSSSRSPARPPGWSSPRSSLRRRWRSPRSASASGSPTTCGSRGRRSPGSPSPWGSRSCRSLPGSGRPVPSRRPSSSCRSSPLRRVRPSPSPTPCPISSEMRQAACGRRRRRSVGRPPGPWTRSSRGSSWQPPSSPSCSPVPARLIRRAGALILASVVAIAGGVILSGRPTVAARQRGWEVQAVALGGLAAGWVGAMAGRRPALGEPASRTRGVRRCGRARSRSRGGAW